jgi:hypothetical protein
MAPRINGTGVWPASDTGGNARPAGGTRRAGDRMILINSLLDALCALYVTEPTLVVSGLFGALVIAYALIVAACLTVRVTR